MSPTLWIIIGVVVLLVLYVIGTYNSLIKLRNRVRDQWAQIEVQLKRRFDLIPNIVETVKGYAKHESETLKGVIEARNKFTVASTKEQEIEASNQLTGAVRQLFALSESYPELKADTNFLKLQSNLEETENKISSARQFYNDTVLSLNNKVELFPSNLVAKIFGFKKEAFFEAEAEAKVAPKVEF
ncbi:MAG: LemA family protein [Tenericutes bacterium]|nr:LemA family protein [Mycoplasmatota bacterium]